MGRNSSFTSVSESGDVAQSLGLDFVREYLREVQRVAGGLDAEEIERASVILANTRRRGGRLFVLGVGGSAANASHLVNDFRALTGLTPTAWFQNSKTGVAEAVSIGA